jgi:AbiJ-like protein
MPITEITRRAIFDSLIARRYDWAGRLREDDFLSRLYDLNALPADDHRFETAAGDIHQHRVQWKDWENDWVFYDLRFNSLHGPDEDFLRFLCETVHPIVRGNEEEALRLVELYNEHLRRDGWELYQHSEVSGRPVFAARTISADAEIFPAPTGWPKIDRQIGEIRLRLREARAEEQFQAVGHLCREALITVAQTVYERQRHHRLTA